MSAYGDYARHLRVKPVVKPDIKDIIRFATLAANGHNTQPWRFAVEDSYIALFRDGTRRTPAVDPDDHHLFVSLGCTAENLAIAACVTGRPGEILLEPGDGSAVRFQFLTGPPAPNPLFNAIPLRQSTRTAYDGHPVPTADLAALERAGAEPGVSLILVTDRRRMDQIRDLVVAGNDAQMADRAFMAELKHWLRFNPHRAAASGDGLFSATSGNPILPDLLGRLAFDAFFSADAERDRYARQIDPRRGWLFSSATRRIRRIGSGSGAPASVSHSPLRASVSSMPSSTSPWRCPRCVPARRSGRRTRQAARSCHALRLWTDDAILAASAC
jgi:hypothetical protein